jgi:hypothetical protein
MGHRHRLCAILTHRGYMKGSTVQFPAIAPAGKSIVAGLASLRNDYRTWVEGVCTQARSQGQSWASEPGPEPGRGAKDQQYGKRAAIS